MTPAIERALSDLHALLGETTEAAAAVQMMRDLVRVPRTGGEADAVFCVNRLTLAIHEAIKRSDAKAYAQGVADEMADAAEEAADEDTDDWNGINAAEDLDGDHESGLASVYGPDNDADEGEG